MFVGNRRIAAIKWLMEEVESKGTQLSQQVADSIKKLDVLELVGEDLNIEEIKKATWFLQGLRHISGVKAWGPYQQAELITQFKAEGLNFTEAGQAVGISARKAGQMLRAYNALNQMQEDDEYQELAHPNLFSHFQQAIVKTQVKGDTP